jgi:hydrogenase expression/formation protein HypD
MKIYEFLVTEYGLPCVVTGFEPLDMLQSIYMILKQIQENHPRLENQYARSVTWEGNKIAQKLLDEIFIPCEMEWRGIGRIPESGLIPNSIYQDIDAGNMIPVDLEPSSGDNPLCICGDIMLGVKTPVDCLLFGNACNPESPKGACMVSAEGSCATHLKYSHH